MADRVSYRQVTLYLDDEFRKFGDERAAVVKRAMALRPRQGRRLRTVSNIIIPDPWTKPRLSKETKEN